MPPTVSAHSQFGSPALIQPKALTFNIMRFSVHDGPGIRTTVFLKGCSLSCWWCHNPEGQDIRPDIMYAAEFCVRCGDCVPACTCGALVWRDGPVRDASLCQRCGACVHKCVTTARQLAGEWMGAAELMRAIRRDIIFFDESGGGVTFSGGEPLLWPDFLETALAACKAEGIHTAVDTCGYAQAKTVARIASQADLFLFDLKLIDSARHMEATGVDNEIILANLTMLIREGKRVIVRMPVVPGINDDRENVEAIMDFLAGIGVRRIDLLPYHDIGAGKYQRLQVVYRLAELRPPSADQMQDLSDRFKERDFAVHIGG